MPTPADPAEVLEALAAVFRAKGIRWYLFGAQAVAAYGVPRLSGDVDATVQFPVEDVADLTEAMEAAGFARRVTDIEDLARRTRVLPVTHVATGTPVDVVLAGSSLEEEFLSRAHLMQVGGVAVPVIAAADLIITKVLAGRPKDLEDVEGIIRRGGPDLDLEAARRILEALDQALDRADLAARLDQIVRATRQAE